MEVVRETILLMLCMLGGILVLVALVIILALLFAFLRTVAEEAIFWFDSKVYERETKKLKQQIAKMKAEEERTTEIVDNVKKMMEEKDE